jgi:hypothetical protein
LGSGPTGDLSLLGLHTLRKPEPPREIRGRPEDGGEAFSWEAEAVESAPTESESGRRQDHDRVCEVSSSGAHPVLWGQR